MYSIVLFQRLVLCTLILGMSTDKVVVVLIASFSAGVCNGTNTTCLGCNNIPNSGLVNDACGKCGGNGSTCTEIMATIPQTIASSQPTVWVIGAGLNGGSETVCGFYDPLSGDQVVNTTGKYGKYRPCFDIVREMGYLLPIYIDTFWFL